MKKLGLEDLEAILAVATRRNFRAAAIDVGLSPSVLSQRVSAIESRLGVRLFNRTTRSVSLTEVGAKFVAEVELGVSTIKHAVDMANDYRETPTGLLRINSSVGAARRILSPVLLAFAELNPDIFVDLVTEDRPIDIVAEGFDAGVRPSDAVPKDMIALRLEPQQSFSVVGTPGYFEGRTVPRVPYDLMQHKCIRARLPSGGIERWEFEQDGRCIKVDVQGQLTLDEASLMLEAALSGAGLAYLADWWTKDMVRDGRLVRILGEFAPTSPGLSLYYPSRRYQPAALMALTNFIAHSLKSNRRP